MAPEPIIDLMQQALQTALFLALPPMALMLIVGLSVALFQAVTSIQEQTLVFIPKILAAGVALLIFMPWMVSTVVDFTRRLYEVIPDIIH